MTPLKVFGLLRKLIVSASKPVGEKKVQPVVAYLLSLVFLLSAGTSFAQYEWVGGVNPANLSNVNNWDPQNYPSLGERLTFASNPDNWTINNDLNNLELGRISFSAGADHFELTGNGLSLNSDYTTTATLLNSSATDQIINFESVKVKGVQTWQQAASNGTLTVGSDVILNSSLVIDSVSDSTVFLNRDISGAGGLVKVGSGNLTLSGGNNTYTGGTTINGGTLNISQVNQLGDSSATLIFGGGTLNYDGGTESRSQDTKLTTAGGTFQIADGSILTHDGLIFDAGALTKTGDGTLVLTQNNSYSGGTFINGGTLQVQAGTFLGASGPSGDVTFDGGTLNMTSTFNLSRELHLNEGGGTLEVSGNVLNQIGLIDGIGSLTKTGAGNLILQANNSFTGGLNINEGKVLFNNDNQLGAAGGEIGLNGGILQLQSGTVTTDRTTTLSTAGGTLRASNGTSFIHNGEIQGFGPLIKDGGGTLLLGGENSFVGKTLIQGGELKTTGNERLFNSSEVVIDAGASLNLDGFSETIGGLSGAGTVNLGAGTLSTGLANRDQSFDGLLTGSGDLVKQGTGTLTLNNSSNDYSGGTTVEAGTLSISADGALGASGSILTLDGGTLQATDSFTLNRDINEISVGTIEVTDANVLTTGLATNIDSAGVLTKTGNGILELAGTASISNRFDVSNGTIRLANNERLSDSTNLELDQQASLELSGFNETIGRLAGKGEINLGGGTLTVSGDTDSVFSGEILGNGNFVKDGSSVLQIARYAGSSGMQHSGDTIINNGTLHGLNSDIFSNQSTVTINENGTFKTFMEETIGGLSGSGTVIIDGGSSRILRVGNNGDDTSFAGSLQGDASSEFVKLGSGTLVLGNNQDSFAGKVFVNSGTLSISASENLGTGASNIRLAGGSLQTTSGFSLNRGISLNADSTIDTVASTLLNMNGEISGSAGLTKAGAGTLWLNGTSTFSGPTNITEGILLTGNSQVFNNQMKVTVAAGASFNINSNTETIGSLSGSGIAKIASGVLEVGANNNSTSFNGEFIGNGQLIKIGNGTLTLNNNSSFAGITRISSGTLSISNSSNLGIGTSELEMAGGTLLTTADLTLSRGIEFLSSSTIDTAPGTELTLEGALTGSGGLIKIGTGELLLGNSVGYAGETTIDRGTIRALVSNSFADNSGIIVGNSGLLDINNLTDTIGSLSGAGTVQLGTGTLRVGANDESTSFSGSLQGSDSALLVKQGTGTFTLGGSIPFAGDIRFEAGTLSISSAANLGTGTSDLQFAGGALESTGNISLNRGAVIESTGTFSTAESTVLTLGQPISGAGTLIKSGAGELELFGNNSYLGGTRLDNGILTISADSNLGDTSSGLVFDGGVLRTNSTLSLNRNAVLEAGGGGFQTDAGTTLNQSGLVSGAGDLTKSGSGELILSAAGNSADKLKVNAGTLTLASGTASMTTNSTSLNGGTLQADTVRVSDSGTASYRTGSVSGNGQVNADISGDGTITASSGALVLGDASSASGFDFDGTLTVNNNATARLNSAVNASLGNQTILNNGTLNSSNGIELDAGATLEGNGTVKGSFVNQGTVVGGNGPGIVFQGDVGGAGDFFGTSIFNGTLRPGNSPAQVSFENLVLNGTLEMEIGGNIPGSGYDQLIGHSHLESSAILRGALNVSLLSGTSSFFPSLGDTFDLIIANFVFADFDVINLPELMDGMYFMSRVVELENDLQAFQVWVAGTDASVPEPSSIILLAVGLLLLARSHHQHSGGRYREAAR